MIRLTLCIDGMKIPYETEGVNGRSSIRAFKLLEKLERDDYRYDDQIINELVGFVVGLFDGQFTADDFLDGCPGSLFVVGPQLLSAVIQDVASAIQEIPQDPTGAAPVTV